MILMQVGLSARESWKSICHMTFPYYSHALHCGHCQDNWESKLASWGRAEPHDGSCDVVFVEVKDGREWSLTNEIGVEKKSKGSCVCISFLYRLPHGSFEVSSFFVVQLVYSARRRLEYG